MFYRFSFQREERDSNRVLKGVMRVGHLAKGLLLRGDCKVQLVVLCADKPTLTLLRRVVELLPASLKQVSTEHQYQVTLNAADAALTVSGDGLEVTASLTSPVMREQGWSLLRYGVEVFVRSDTGENGVWSVCFIIRDNR